MLRYYLETVLFRTLLAFINLFSLSAARRIGRMLGLLNYYISRIRLDVVERQLKECFPEKTNDEIHKLIRLINISFGYTAVEFCWFSTRQFQEIEDRVKIEGENHLKEALAHKKGCIIFSGHFGNWELAAQVFGSISGGIYAVAKRQKNPYFNTLINQIRGAHNIFLIDKKVALRGIVGALKENKLILMLGDQHAGKTGVPARFLGKIAPTNPGTAKIALKYHVPIILAVCYRRNDGRFVLHMNEPIIPEVHTNIEDSVQEYTQFFTSELEQWVRKIPWQWFWFHRRWKV